MAFMGHTTQSVGGRHAIFSDADIIAIVCLLREQLEERGRPGNDALERVVVGWEKELEGYGPGVINLALEAIVRVPDVAGAVRSGLASLQGELEARSEPVPAAILNKRCRAPGVTFADYRPALLIAAIQKLMALTMAMPEPRTQSVVCCICGQGVGIANAAQLLVFVRHDSDESQRLFCHGNCLDRVLHESIPRLPDLSS
jgi:hypothetical protein